MAIVSGEGRFLAASLGVSAWVMAVGVEGASLLRGSGELAICDDLASDGQGRREDLGRERVPGTDRLRGDNL